MFLIFSLFLYGKPFHFWTGICSHFLISGLGKNDVHLGTLFRFKRLQDQSCSATWFFACSVGIRLMKSQSVIIFKMAAPWIRSSKKNQMREDSTGSQALEKPYFKRKQLQYWKLSITCTQPVKSEFLIILCDLSTCHKKATGSALAAWPSSEVVVSNDSLQIFPSIGVLWRHLLVPG